jgi:hypothetical protein
MLTSWPLVISYVPAFGEETTPLEELLESQRPPIKPRYQALAITVIFYQIRENPR